MKGKLFTCHFDEWSHSIQQSRKVVSKVYGGQGLPDETIRLKINGSCGNSFGVFSTKGILFEIEGEANDYFGKGLSGGKLVIYPPKVSSIVAHENMNVLEINYE